VKTTAAGPGLPMARRAPVPAPARPPVPHSSWWIDADAGELVRTADGRRWDTRDVPELARSSRDRNAVDLDAVDAWVNEQTELD